MINENLDKHTFIAGVTGSGKTTTCHRLLESSKMPFLVIEPAKTEYRVLTKKNKDILIFTLGNDNVAPFRLNPFEFFPHENITSRVDMIKASIESAFDMEAAIPQLIEAAIYRCYEDKGWNIATSKNKRFDDPFAAGVYAFPTLSELIAMTERVVVDQGFDDRLKQDYIGSIKARLQGLLIGSKGLMLDTPRSINFKDLATESVILELEEIRNPSEKSLIMGFVLANLNEAIRANHYEYQSAGKKFRHITLIEEAHRLLSKFEPGDSQNKKQGVEAFADMLAEVRKYGESLIIVDQIPNKLTPEVLKNTNTKIIHKLFAKDDKEAVGNTMALSDEQKDFLSNLEPGRVILSSSGMSKPLQVQIKELVSTTNEKDVSPSNIRQLALAYYAKNYKSGLIQGLELLDEQPSRGDVRKFLHGEIAEAWYETLGKEKDRRRLIQYMNKFGWTFMHQYISLCCYNPSSAKDKETREATLYDFLSCLNEDSETRISMHQRDEFRKDIKVRG
ncbi:ATP-binding protein [Vibrio cyclitrophicus]|uniref:ATP-binding protein n=1 Tax=Vibrio cyclitrophicus TaxID=47951 RepID=UPI00399B1EC6